MRRKLNNSKGVVMPTIIIIIAIVTLLSISAIFVIDNQTLAVSRTKIGEDAIHIAEAGYNYYLWHLNDDTQFYRIGLDKDGKLVPETYYTEAENDLWVDFPKEYEPVEYASAGKVVGYYRLHIVPPSIGEPVVTIRSTGWTTEKADNKKTIEVKVHKKLFTNYVCFAGDMSTPSGTLLYWGDGEEVRGPFHTNGNLLTTGRPIFHDDVCFVKIWNRGGNPDFKKPGQPQKVESLIFPESNKSLAYWGEEVNGGYKYEGRTCVLLDNSTLHIRNVKINNNEKQELDLPPSSVIYIKGDLYISGVLDGRLTILVEGNIYITRRDPTDYNYNNAKYTGGIEYANTNIPTLTEENPIDPSDDMLGLVSNGNIYVHSYGWPKWGKAWPWSKEGEYIDTSYRDSSSTKNITIHAALFGYSTKSCYGVQDYNNLGNMGRIYFTGSQVFSKMGATYTTSGSRIYGYKEDNTFDLRMRYDAPPHFLEPKNSGWEVKSWRQITPP